MSPRPNPSSRKRPIANESSVVGLGLDFLLEMRKRTRDVFEYPDRFPPFSNIEGVHCAHAVERFPHIAVYMISGDTVHVLAYMHPRQRPGYWAHRVP